MVGAKAGKRGEAEDDQVGLIGEAAAVQVLAEESGEETSYIMPMKVTEIN